MKFRLFTFTTCLMIFCGTASAGMDCNVKYPNGVLSDNAFQDLFAYAVDTADNRNNNHVFIDKIVNGLKSPTIKSYEDGFNTDPAYGIFANHAAVQKGVKTSEIPCASSSWTTYAPTLFYYLAVKNKAIKSTNGRIDGPQVVTEYQSLVKAFNSVVKTANAAKKQSIATCLDASGWNGFLHASPHTPIFSLERAVKRGGETGIINFERAFRGQSLKADGYAVAAAACAVR